MYSININYGIEPTNKVFIKEKELKKAFSSEKEFEKFMNKLYKEVKRYGTGYKENKS